METLIHNQNAPLSIAMIIAGIFMFSFDLLRIYKYLVTRKWTVIVGSVFSVSTIAVFYRLITFTYSISRGAKPIKASQMIIRDIWAENLWVGSQIPLRYDGYNPNSVIIDHQPVWSYLLIGSLNYLWIFFGLVLLFWGLR